MAFAWVASEEDLQAAGIALRRKPHSTEYYVLASSEVGRPAEARAELLAHDDGNLWIGAFDAPFGDCWRDYVTALTGTAVAHAGELGCAAVWVDVYEFGDATREPLAELGFSADPEGGRFWTLSLDADER
jgi:hypothetical protein